MSHLRLVAVILPLMLVVCPGRARAGMRPQEPQPPAPARLETLERSNAELRERLRALEQRSAAAAGQEPEEPASADEPKVSVRVFADFGASFDDRRRAQQGHTEFAFGTLDLFASLQLGEHVQVVSETLLEGDGEISLDQERLWTRWTINDTLYLKIGLEHSPISHFNRRFHHGKWLYRSLDRPRLDAFEDDGGILSTHYAGVEVGGQLQTDAGRLDYTAVISNGRGPTPTQRNILKDDNDSKAFDVALALTPPGTSDLHFGGALRFEEVPGIAGNPLRALSVGQWTTTAFVDYQLGGLIVMAEGAFIADQDRTSRRDFEHLAGYLELAYSLGDLTPYARLESTQMALGDPFFAAVDADLDHLRQIVGVRYDVSSNTALKLELGVDRAEERDAGGAVERDSFLTAGLQLAWVF